MFIDPEQYSSASTYELLEAAALAQIGKDHRWLRALLERGDAIVPDLLDVMANEFLAIDDDALPIARALRSPAAIPVLVSLARECEEEFPDELVSAFRKLGEAAVEPLLELREELEDPWEVDSVLASLGVRDPRILSVLLEELEQNPVDGAISLSMYGDPAARPALIEALESVEQGWNRQQVEEAIQSLDNPQPHEAPTPYDIWADYPAEALPWFDGMEEDELVEFLDSPLARYRAEALRSLGIVAMDLEPELRDRILEIARTDPDPDVRGAAWEALDMNLDEPAIHRAMAERLEAPDTPPLERAGAVFAFASHGEGRDLSRWLLDLHKRPETRASALRAMRLTEDPHYATYFVKYLDDPDLDVRRAAIMGIGTFEISPAADRLREFFNDEELRTDALCAYAESAPAPLSRDGMFDLLDRIENLAGGLSEEEERFIKGSIDERLERHGRPRMFAVETGEEEEEQEQEEDEVEEPAVPYVAPPKIGRNQPCPCGSGKKYKKCCGK